MVLRKHIPRNIKSISPTCNPNSDPTIYSAVLVIVLADNINISLGWQSWIAGDVWKSVEVTEATLNYIAIRGMKVYDWPMCTVERDLGGMYRGKTELGYG
jgi:hypothetical protein